MDRQIVFQSLDAAASELICSRLKAAGFHADVEHELSAATATGWSLGAGGVRVVVPQSEAADARALIESAGPEE